MLLQSMTEAVTGMELSALFGEYVFAVLGMAKRSGRRLAGAGRLSLLALLNSEWVTSA